MTTPDSPLKSAVKSVPIARAAAEWLLKLQRRRAGKARFRRDFQTFAQAAAQTAQRFPLRWEDRQPILDEWTSSTGFDRHYVYHTAWAARILSQRRPAEHVDVSSSLYFAAIASAFVPIRFLDYRPANLQLSGLTSGRGDLNRLPFEDKSLPSISCMHVVEHVGLGRYGDPIDPDGDLKSMRELQRVVAPGGDLLFVTPVGRPRICFNAHRVYSRKQVVEGFAPLVLHEFALVPDDPAQGLIVNASDQSVAEQSYGCGCFWFKGVTGRGSNS